MLNMGVPPPNTTGILLPGLEGRTVRDDGTDAGPDEVGELWLRGGNITPGYWNNPKANAETFVDGWLRTGDQFRANEKGYFLYVPRLFLCDPADTLLALQTGGRCVLRFRGDLALMGGAGHSESVGRAGVAEGDRGCPIC
jgi:acyl-CoA synthetase (AMP-forming)/AMP-acid ligase II